MDIERTQPLMTTFGKCLAGDVVENVDDHELYLVVSTIQGGKPQTLAARLKDGHVDSTETSQPVIRVRGRYVVEGDEVTLP